MQVRARPLPTRARGLGAPRAVPRPDRRLSSQLRAVLAPVAFATLAAGAVAGCGKGAPPPPSLDVKPQYDTAGTIPAAPLAGTLRKKPFTLADARFYVDHRVNFEKLTIELNASKAPETCALLADPSAPRVWLRRKGDDDVKPGEVKLVAGQVGEWEVHYQTRDEEAWVGNGDASALVVFTNATGATHIEGLISVCFADGEASCVAGSFSAERCVIGIDATVRGGEPREKVDPALAVPAASLTPAPSASSSAAASVSASASPAGAPDAGAPRDAGARP